MNTNDINTGNEHPEIREQLRNLPRLRASDDFVKNLQLKIDIHNAEAGSMHAKVNSRTEQLEKSGFFKNIFGAGWTMPAAGITVAAAIVFAIVFWNKGTDTVIQDKLSNNKPTEIIQEKTQTPNSNTSEVLKKTEDKLKQDIASIDKPVIKEKPAESNSKLQFNSLKSKNTDEVAPAPTLEKVVTTTDKKVNTNFTEEKSGKTNQSDDANLRKLQMGNARGGDSKANPPSTSPRSSDTEQSGRLTDTQTTKSAPVKKTVKDVNDLSKTSLESIKAKIK